MAKMKEYQNPQDNALQELLYTEEAPAIDKKNDNNSKKKNSKLDAIRPPQKKVMTCVDYRNTSLHYNRGVPIDVQKSRVSSTINYQPMSADYVHRHNTLVSKLPAHMQNQAARISLGCGATSNTLKSNHNRDQPFLDPSSSFGMRKDFWVDPKKVKAATTEKAVKEAAGKTGAKNKKNLTFNQLL